MRAQSDQAAGPAKSRRNSRWRRYIVGCLIFLVMGLVGLPILHITFLRPMLERELVKLAELSMNETIEVPEYRGPLVTESIEEEAINLFIKDIVAEMPFIESGRSRLRQDEIEMAVIILSQELRVKVDVRANSDGELIVRSAEANWPLQILLSEDVIAETIADYVNREIIRAGNLAVHALQITDGQIFVAYGPRSD